VKLPSERGKGDPQNEESRRGKDIQLENESEIISTKKGGRRGVKRRLRTSRVTKEGGRRKNSVNMKIITTGLLGNRSN